MAEEKKHVYDESKIKTLSSIDHIRLRTGMYIGRIGDGSHHDDGCYILLKEVVDNSVDEFIMGHGREIRIDVEGRIATVRDFGRGIPLGKVIDCVSQINTGAKYNDDVFQFSVGLNGVGTKAVNALSKEFIVRSQREGKFVEAAFKQGRLKKEDQGKTAEPDGTFIRFEPDPVIFKDSDFRPEFIERRLRHYSYLNSGLKLVFNGQTFQSHHGLLDLVMEDLRGDNAEPIYAPLHYSEKTLEFCFTHTNGRYGETFYSFVNGQYTADGGTHLSAFREGLLKAVNEYSKAGYEGDDVRECMVGAVAIRLKDPVFESQTKNKLGNTEIRSELVNKVREELLHFFSRNKEVAEKIMAKVEDTRQLPQGVAGGEEAGSGPRQGDHPAHPAAQGLQDPLRPGEREGARVDGFSDRGPVRRRVDRQLPGCQHAGHLRSQRETVERLGPQAGHRLSKRRDVQPHVRARHREQPRGPAIRKGDPRHRRRRGRSAHPQFADHVFFQILRPTGPGRPSVRARRRPLFRARNKEKTVYCYSETERDSAAAALGKSCEITRFKGLGEISPAEFKQFIGKEMRLSKVEFANKSDVADILGFYMGKNTPERKDYIMENLVVPVED